MPGINKIKQFLKNQRELLELHGPKVRSQHFLKKILRILIRAYNLPRRILNFLYQSLKNLKQETFQKNSNYKKINFYYNFQSELELFIFVDHTLSCGVNTGVQRIVRGLSRSLSTHKNIIFVEWNEVNKTFYSISDTKRESLLNTFSYLDKINTTQPLNSGLKEIEPSSMLSSWLIVPEVPYLGNKRVLLSDIYKSAIKLNLKTAALFYDATPIFDRSFSSESADDHSVYMKSLNMFDLVLPISKFSSSHLSSFLSFDQNIIQTTIRTIEIPSENIICHTKKSLENPIIKESYALCVGSITPHKNSLLLTEAFDLLSTNTNFSKFKLVFVGNIDTSISRKFSNVLKQNPNIIYMGNIDDEMLSNLYQNCLFTIFPSTSEGYGLPIIESLKFNKPCICFNQGAPFEVAQKGGCLPVDTTDSIKLSEAIKLLFLDEKLRDNLIKQTKKINFINWKDYTNNLLKECKLIDHPNIGNIYYWVDHTARYPSNTGIQRVVRMLAKSLIVNKFNLIPVIWDAKGKKLIEAPISAKKNISKYNGPLSSGWKKFSNTPFKENDWFLCPELTHEHSSLIVKFCKHHSLRMAWIFYDAIPVKVKEFYNDEVTKNHEEYMKIFSKVNKVLSISHTSNYDLLNFLTSKNINSYELDKKILPVELPGEFLQKRNIDIKKLVRKNNKNTINILCVGTVEPRKNHLNLIKAIKLLNSKSDSKIIFTIAGNSPYSNLKMQVLSELQDMPNSTWVNSPSDSDLQKLYEESTFTVYPSIEEGFGLPILESLWNGKPCICSSESAMGEVAKEGGCLTTDVKKPKSLCRAMITLINNTDKYNQLVLESVNRSFKSWNEYSNEIIYHLSNERNIPAPNKKFDVAPSKDIFNSFKNLHPNPILSICISTFNRAKFLNVTLRHLFGLIPENISDIEIIVCDNASFDNTSKIVKPFLHRDNFIYKRNKENVGMVGNLYETAILANGEYVWLIGDDDLIGLDTINKIKNIITSNFGISLLYLNYSYTNESKYSTSNVEKIINTSTPVVEPSSDYKDYIFNICAKSGNIFTGIYCIIFRRDHAIKTFSQNTEGRPFSSMLTSIPTTYYILNNMMNEKAYWVGSPSITVNLNVSWKKYAPVWILARLPEAFSMAKRYGASPNIDKWLDDLVPHVVYWFKFIFKKNKYKESDLISIRNLINTFKKIPRFNDVVYEMRDIYKRAYKNGHPIAIEKSSVIFGYLEDNK